MREPLLHFVLLGGVLFGVDHLLFARTADPRVIVVDRAVDENVIKVFRDARGREPNDDELYALRRVWLDNEVLYREGIALQLDKGDSTIRDRIIFKMLSSIEPTLKLPQYDDTTLRAWFEAHRDKYDSPARYDFQEAVLHGANSESAVRAFVSALNAGAPGDAQAGLRVFEGRPLPSLAQSYGADFAKRLGEAPVGTWIAIQTTEGWRAMRLDRIAPAQPADFDALHAAVLQDWIDATLSEQRSAAVRAMAQRYTVQYAAPKS